MRPYAASSSGCMFLIIFVCVMRSCDPLQVIICDDVASLPTALLYASVPVIMFVSVPELGCISSADTAKHLLSVMLAALTVMLPLFGASVSLYDTDEHSEIEDS